MATYLVMPLPDGVSQRYGWQVRKQMGGSSKRVSKHYKKSAAKRTARRKAGDGDSVRTTTRNGRFQ